MDREKVIKGLEQIVNDPFMRAKADYWVIICSDAIALLKEQEAVSITTDYFDGFGNKTSHCPSCNSRLVWHQNKNYCGECGRSLKWE